MRITKNQLRQIIKEELSAVLKEERPLTDQELYIKFGFSDPNKNRIYQDMEDKGQLSDEAIASFAAGAAGRQEAIAGIGTETQVADVETEAPPSLPSLEVDPIIPPTDEPEEETQIVADPPATTELKESR